MSKLIKLNRSNMRPLTGDIFTVITSFYSEDNDIKDETGSNFIRKAEGQENNRFFRREGYTTDSGGNNPLKYPRQFYIKNDQSGSIDSDFSNELETGDIIHLISGDTERPIEHSFEVLTTDCVDCSANIVKVSSKDVKDSTNNGWDLFNERELTRTYVDDDGNTQTLNFHATKSYMTRKEDVNDTIYIKTDDISSYESHSTYTSEMLVTFKEGVFPKGGYVVLKDIVHTGALNDIVIDASGYTGNQVEIKIEIDSTTNPETFKWRFGDYIHWSDPSSAYAEEQRGLSLQFTPLNLGNGEIRVKWLATTGHTSDTWTFTVYPNSKRIYKNKLIELDQTYKQ
jgi:hypothetical protein